MISHGAVQGYWVAIGSGAAFAFVVVDCLVVVVIFVALTVVVVDLELEFELDLEVGFAPEPVLVDCLAPVAFALPLVVDFGASVAPFTVAVGPAGGAR